MKPILSERAERNKGAHAQLFNPFSRSQPKCLHGWEIPCWSQGSPLFVTVTTRQKPLAWKITNASQTTAGTLSLQCALCRNKAESRNPVLNDSCFVCFNLVNESSLHRLALCNYSSQRPALTKLLKAGTDFHYPPPRPKSLLDLPPSQGEMNSQLRWMWPCQDVCTAFTVRTPASGRRGTPEKHPLACKGDKGKAVDFSVCGWVDILQGACEYNDVRRSRETQANMKDKVQRQWDTPEHEHAWSLCGLLEQNFIHFAKGSMQSCLEEGWWGKGFPFCLLSVSSTHFSTSPSCFYFAFCLSQHRPHSPMQLSQFSPCIQPYLQTPLPPGQALKSTWSPHSSNMSSSDLLVL